jgi:mRNA-degrading endonuclease toxin of MazEF toxin-antitoxin module
VTTRAKGHAFEIPLPKESGVRGAVMVHQLKSLDWIARRARLAGKAPPRVVAAAQEILKDIIES